MLHRAQQVAIGLRGSLGIIEERDRAVVAHLERVVAQFPKGRRARARLAGCRGRSHGMYQPQSEYAAIERDSRGHVISVEREMVDPAHVEGFGTPSLSHFCCLDRHNANVPPCGPPARLLQGPAMPAYRRWWELSLSAGSPSEKR